MSKDAGPVGWLERSRSGRRVGRRIGVAFSKLNQVDFEEGWHFVRVLPWTVDGDPIPIEEPADEIANVPMRASPFYVLPDADLEEDLPSERCQGPIASSTQGSTGSSRRSCRPRTGRCGTGEHRLDSGSNRTSDRPARRND